MVQSFCHDSLYEKVQECWREEAALSHPDCRMEPFADVVVDKHSAAGFGVQWFDGVNKFPAHVILSHYVPQSLVLYPIESFL